ncbi:MAG: alpha-glucan family phosphorylase [Planctomycetota bacterium]|nr:alpha-glucan family phosphorylase [Planctomycetota bacterium]
MKPEPDLVNHNPVEFLDRCPEEVIEEKASELALETRINHAFHGLRDYLEAEDTWGVWHGGPLHAQPVAYFSAEFGLHESLPIYSGGLGVLAGDHVKAASDLAVPMVAVGLFYATGYFRQTLDEHGRQQEDYSAPGPEKLVLERVRRDDGTPRHVQVRTKTSRLRIGAWTARVGRCRLLLLDTNVEGNSDEDRALTARLYGGDQRTRIRQELVLGVGGMRMLEALGIYPSVVHLNEGHCAFAVLELARGIMEREDRSFEDVVEKAAAMTAFTTHTPVEAGHDRFTRSLVEETLGPLREDLGLSRRELMELGRVRPSSREEPFCMTVLGMKMSRSRNAVSALHARISRSMWRELWPKMPEDQIPIGYITNGVHVGTWLAVPMGRMYDRALGEDWRERMDDPATWMAIDDVDEVEFWEQHQILRSAMIDSVRRRLSAQQAARNGTKDGKNEQDEGEAAAPLDPSVLTIGFARRFAPYKRPTLLFRDADRLAKLISDADRPVQVIFAGKAHPADDEGKRLIQQLFEFTRDSRFAGRVVFVEDYDINIARHLVQGVDVWLNTPRRPMEASGTSGQKVVLNGGLNLSILDGWWAEGYNGRNGFAIGRGGEHVDPGRQDERDALDLYETLEREVIPMFYDRDERGLPRRWIARQKHAIRTLAWRFSARRMLIDYTFGCYLPAAGGLTSSFAIAGRTLE